MKRSLLRLLAVAALQGPIVAFPAFAAMPGDEILVVTNRISLGKEKGCAAYADDPDPDKVVSLVVVRRPADGSCELKPLPNGDEDALFNALKERFGGASKKNLVLFLHGSGQTFANMLDKASGVAQKQQVLVLSLDWPMAKSTGNYVMARGKADGAAAIFGPLLNRLMARIAKDEDLRPRTVDVFAHSLGNYVLQKMVLDAGAEESFAGVRRVTLNAPDVMLTDQRGFIEKISGRGAAVYVVINRNDRVIRCAADLGGFGPIGTALCNKIVSNRIKGERLGNRIPGAELAAGATYLDVTLLEGIGNGHEYYLGKPASAKEIYLRLSRAGGKAASFDGIRFQAAEDGRVLIFK